MKLDIDMEGLTSVATQQLVNSYEGRQAFISLGIVFKVLGACQQTPIAVSVQYLQQTPDYCTIVYCNGIGRA